MSLGYYVSMLGDRRRIEGFQKGLASAVQPGDKVLEVGTGLGTYAFFAAQAGAAHVWAVDRDPVIHAAAMVCKTNGLHDRITFLRGDICEVELPEPADLVVFEDFPIRLFDDRTWRLVRDVLGKHLRPGGRVFPTRMRLNLGLAAGLEPEALVALGDLECLRAFDLDWSCLRPYLANAPRQASISPDALVGDRLVGPELSLNPLPTSEELALEAEWTLERDVSIHGLVMWFDLVLGPDSWYENAPGEEDSVWGQTLLPISPPLVVPARGQVRASVRPEPLPDGAPGWLSWAVESGAEARDGHEFAAEPASLRDLYGDILGMKAAETLPSRESCHDRSEP